MQHPPASAPSSPVPSSRRTITLGGVGITLLTLALLASIGAIWHFGRLGNENVAYGSKLVNLTARQRMLSQRLSKSLVLLRDDVRETGKVRPTVLAETTAAFRLFDVSLEAMLNGGTTTGADGQPAVLAALTEEKARAAATQGHQLWQPLKAICETLTSDPEATTLNPAVLAEAIAYVRANSVKLLGLMNDMTVATESNISVESRRLSTLQGAAIAGAILSFLGIIAILFARQQRDRRRIGQSAESLATANAELSTRSEETGLILSTVRQGMLLMDRDGTIGSQHSAALTEMFQTEHLAGFNFQHVLQRILSEKIFLTTKDYFTMLFDPSKKEKLLAKINPLARVEANFSRPEGGFVTKHMEFAFGRIRAADGESIARVFISVRDITQQIELEERFKQSEQKKERQFELLLGILHVGPDQLKDFIAMVETELKQVNETLKAEDFAAAASGPRQIATLRERLDRVFRAVHNIKGNADYLKLEHFSKAAHTFESAITDLKNRSRLTGDDFLSVAIQQAELRNDLAEVRDLTDKLAGLRQGLAPATTLLAAEPAGAEAAARPAAPVLAGPVGNSLFEGVRSLAATLAARLGKEVDVQTVELNGTTPPEAFRGLTRDILIQLTRNSLVHGVEPPAERLARGKAQRATVFVGPAANPEAGYPFGFVFRDDGRGLDPARIRQRAVERGLISGDAARAMSDAEAATLVFAPGFSTADEVTGDAGRGVGLDLVKTRLIDELGGEVLIESEPGRFTEFTFLLPAAAYAEHRAPAFAGA